MVVRNKKRNTTSKKDTNSSKKGIADRILPVADVPINIKMLAYGRSGTGKTTFTGTAPKPMLVLDMKEEGTTSIRKQKDTFVLPIETWEDIEEIYWYLKNNPDKYKTVVIDTVTQMQDIALKHCRGDSTGLITRQTWGTISGLMKTWLMYFRDLPMNVIFTAQDKQFEVEEFEDTGDIFPEVGPFLMPSVAKILTAAVGFIGQTFIREYEKEVPIKGQKNKTKTKIIKEFCMRVGPHARYLTKFRRDHTASDREIPSFIPNPTFEKILEFVEED